MNTDELNALKDKAYKTAVAHGFHEEERPDAYWFGLVMSEMGEAINADRKGLHADTKRFEEVMAMRCITPRVAFEENIKDSVEDELADIIIWLLDFAGMKGYKLYLDRDSFPDCHDALRTFEESGLPGLFFIIMDNLSDAFDCGELQTCIYDIICFFGDWFEKVTGSDHDLWWFVKQKMKYNETRAMLNGKRY